MQWLYKMLTCILGKKWGYEGCSWGTHSPTMWWCYTVPTHGFTADRLAAEEITETLSGPCVRTVCDWWGHPLHTFIQVRRGHRWNQLAGVWRCCEVAGWRGGGGWWFSQPHRARALASHVSLTSGCGKAKILVSTHPRQPDGTPGVRKHKERGKLRKRQCFQRHGDWLTAN